MSDFIIDRTNTVLSKVLDGAAERQRILADNIANVDTPDFTRRNVTFEDQVQSALDTSLDDPEGQMLAVNDVEPTATEDAAAPRRENGNNVDIEREMVTVAKNSLQYETATRLLTMKFSMMRTAISEGRQ